MRLLDLFSGAGGAGVGYNCAGFEVVGVDIKFQKHYPFEFHCADAFAFLETHGHEFDVIHASPPCQGYSFLTPIEHRPRHAKMIHEIRDELIRNARPYCIENVVGARSVLRDPLMLCGSMFGLRTQRHRLFEVSVPITSPGMCDHSVIPLLVTTASKASRQKRYAMGMKPKSVLNAPLAYGIDWMDFNGLKEAIPPAYTEWIGKRLLDAGLQGMKGQTQR